MLFRLFVLIAFCSAIAVACVPIEPSRPDSENANYHYLVGITALDEGNPTEALKELLEAEKYDKKDPEIQAGLAQAYWLKNAYNLAEQHYRNAISVSNGEEPKYYNNLAALYLTMERYDDSIEAFKVAAESLFFDRPAVAWTGIGLAYFKKQDYTSAAQAYEKAMEVNNRYYFAPYRLGELYYNQDRIVEALDMFTRAVKLAPGFVDGHYWKGLVHMKMKETSKAKEEFLEVLRLAPGSESARLASGYLKIIDK